MQLGRIVVLSGVAVVFESWRFDRELNNQIRIDTLPLAVASAP